MERYNFSIPNNRTKKSFSKYFSTIVAHASASTSIASTSSITGLREGNVIELRKNSSEKDKGSPCTENSLPYSLARRRVIHKESTVLGVVCISYRSSQ
jgi:hypothetical protein